MNDMTDNSALGKVQSIAGVVLICLGWVLLLSVCGWVLLLSAWGGNQYGPPVPGQPLTWGQQADEDNQLRQQERNGHR